MRFLYLAASLLLLTTPVPTVLSAEAQHPNVVPDLSQSRLFGPNAVVENVWSYYPTPKPTPKPTQKPTPKPTKPPPTKKPPPTTKTPTTPVPTTPVPTTPVPTEAPTTAAPTTQAPTEAPTTETPTTSVPTTPVPTTAAPTSAPDPWITNYGFTNNNIIVNTSIVPYPLHTLQAFTPTVSVVNGVNVVKYSVAPLPVAERFSGPAIFGRAYPSLATVPLASAQKRNDFSQKFNNTVFTSVSQFPKFGAAKLTSIDIFDDEFFGIMRFNGPNPTVIRKISTISPKFGDLTTLHQKYPDIDTQLATGQIYALDYAKINLVPSTAYLNVPLGAPADSILAYPQNPNPGVQPRYMTAPYVLLQHVVENGVSKVVPIAIQLGQPYVAGTTAILYRVDYKDNNGVALSGVDQGDWNYAKTIVNAADAVIHQLEAHLVKTHLITENIIIGTHAKLPQNHPISRLLVGDDYTKGHSYKTLQINEDARNSLIPGIVDEVFAGGYAGAAILVNNFVQTYNYQADYVPNDLAARGFTTPSVADGSDNYLYLQDAQETWTILRNYVDSVLAVQYPTDVDVQQDVAVQSWGTFLGSAQPQFASASFPLLNIPIPGFPKSFTTRAALSDAVTAAIYKSTVGHSVVNYPQPFYNAYIPIYPALALYRPILTATTVGTGLITDEYLAAALGNANTQQVMTATALGLGQPVAASGLPDDLTLLQYATLTSSVTPSTTDIIGQALQTAATTLLSDLTNLSTRIQQRDANNAPHYQYGYFDPSRVANAIFA